jgi:5-methylthioadenosine/S-adenosylhomocysteine deaminase
VTWSSGSFGIIDGIVPPAHAFRRAGGLVDLGSDQASGINCSNIFVEMKLTALFNRFKFRDPTMFTAWEVLRMATIAGALAIGPGDEIGSLEAGKQADLIVVELSSPNLSPILDAPVRNIVPNLVYAASGPEVRAVSVAGRPLLKDGRVLSVDEAARCSAAQEQAECVARHMASDPIHRNLALLTAMGAGRL